MLSGERGLDTDLMKAENVTMALSTLPKYSSVDASLISATRNNTKR